MADRTAVHRICAQLGERIHLHPLEMSSLSTTISLGSNLDEWYFKETKLNCPQIAGYLGFEDTRSFGEWIGSPSSQLIRSEYTAYRETNFEGVVGNCQVHLKHAMDML
jgi:hypothetical protein